MALGALKQLINPTEEAKQESKDMSG